MPNAGKKPGAYTRYPVSHIALYNGVTVLHFLLGGAGIMLGYGLSCLAYLFGALYLVFAFVEMYLVMPLTVCPNCVYYGMKNAAKLRSWPGVCATYSKDTILENETVTA